MGRVYDIIQNALWITYPTLKSKSDFVHILAIGLNRNGPNEALQKGYSPRLPVLHVQKNVILQTLPFFARPVYFCPTAERS